EAMLRGYLDEEEHRKLRTEFPLRRFDPSLFPEFSGGAAGAANRELPVPPPEARRESASLALRADRLRQGIATSRSFDWESLSATLEGRDREALQSLLCLPTL